MPKASYIMTPDMFEDLKSVNGFTEMNGRTYSHHICLIFKEKLTEEQEKKILTESNNEKALEYLKTIVNYTHQYS